MRNHLVLTHLTSKKHCFLPQLPPHLHGNTVSIKEQDKRTLHGSPAPVRSLGGAFLHALLDAQHQVDKPVDLDHPALLPADLDLVQQVVLRFALAAAHGQSLADVLDVLLAGQLGHPCAAAGQRHSG